jgi:hypothetical protein
MISGRARSGDPSTNPAPSFFLIAGRSYTFLFAAFFNDLGDKRVEIDRHPGERSSCHSQPMAGFHGASTRDQLCASAAASPWAHPEQPRRHALDLASAVTALTCLRRRNP